MHTKLADTTALYPLGNSTGHRLFKIPSGVYAGRLAAVYLATSGELRLTFTDPPYQAWSAPSIIAADCNGFAFDAVMLPDGSLHIAYIATSGVSVVARKLTFAGGAWTPAAAVTVYTGDSSLDPSISADLSGRLWLAWTRLVGSTRSIQIKSSNDLGATWGSGPSDLGATLATANTFSYVKLLAAPETLHAVIAQENTRLIMRSLPLAGGDWSDPYIIADGPSGFSQQFDSALGPNGRLAVVYNDSHFRFREFDGSSWSAAVTLSEIIQNSPQVVYRDSEPHILWLQGYNELQKSIAWTSRVQGVFRPATTLDRRASTCDSVLLFNTSAGSYANLTTAAASLATADLFHSASNRLVRDPGDAVLVGLDQRFRYLHFTLSTVGVGGTISYSYWDGSAWAPVIPVSGLVHLDSSPMRVHLWNDYQSIPANWQKKTIAGHSRYWIKCEVVSAFTTGPIGSQLTCISDLNAVNLWR